MNIQKLFLVILSFFILCCMFVLEYTIELKTLTGFPLLLAPVLINLFKLLSSGVLGWFISFCINQKNIKPEIDAEIANMIEFVKNIEVINESADVNNNKVSSYYLKNVIEISKNRAFSIIYSNLRRLPDSKKEINILLNDYNNISIELNQINNDSDNAINKKRKTELKMRANKLLSTLNLYFDRGVSIRSLYDINKKEKNNEY